MKTVVDRLRTERTLPVEELRALLTHCDAETLEYINRQAREVAQAHFGNNVYIRGLIEVSNCCRNDCYYCGIRKSNRKVARYRLSKESILGCCEEGYQLGFRTFVMQGGEDAAFSDEQLL
ncbi:MAG: [FeFe] hydrogenase H-cluster radical SAM maturase HydE, partial [Bacteroides sp.]